MENNHSDLITEYKNDLKPIRKLHSEIAKKHYKIKDSKGNITETVDTRTDKEKADQTILSGIISSTTYTIDWLEQGFEKKFGTLEDMSKLSRKQREQLWGDMNIVGIDLANNVPTVTIEPENNPKIDEDKLQILNHILESLSPREKELFYILNTDFQTHEEAAETMGITIGSVKQMSQRISNKIDFYFKYGKQTSLDI